MGNFFQEHFLKGVFVMQKYIEPFIDSREAAKMIDKEHNKLLRDILIYYSISLFL